MCDYSARHYFLALLGRVFVWLEELVSLGVYMLSNFLINRVNPLCLHCIHEDHKLISSHLPCIDLQDFTIAQLSTHNMVINVT